MRWQTKAALWFVAGVLATATVASAAEVTLYQVTVPERRTLEVPMVGTAQAPQAEMTAEMSFREGQATIEIRYKDMKPAVLLGGDITSYVLWAIARDGAFENLGELKVRDDSDKLEFTSGLKAFSLLVTAETYPRVSRPSELVMFTSGAPRKEKKYPAEAFVFSGLGPAPTVGNKSLAGIAWDRSANLDVVQAERIVDLAGQAGAAQRTPDLWQEQKTALGQARNFNTRSRDRSTTDYAGRAVALASESLQTIRRQNEAAELERQIVARKAEMAALEGRASAAEQQATAAQQQAAAAQQQAEAARQQAEAARQQAEASQQQAEASQQQAMTAQQQLDIATQQKAEAAAAIATAQAELARLADEKTRLEQSVAEESARAEKLKQEKEELSSRLQGALSRVAETTSTARGLIVNLPDILFDLNQATLKPGTREVIAKLSGILLMMPELNLRIEGHTDSTGSREYNQTLSEKRAISVQDFLMSQGIDSKRITAVGYGWDRPVADNSTAAGRSKNRRVEIVIGEGTIQEAPAPAK